MTIRSYALLCILVTFFHSFVTAKETPIASLRVRFENEKITALDPDDRPVPVRVTGELNFQPGRKGPALLTGDQGAYLHFPSELISKDSGTVEFWISPYDWEGHDPAFHLFFQASGKGNLLFYKYHTKDLGLLFLSQGSGKGYPRIANASFENWKKGEWYHLAVTWSPHFQKVYLNGEMIAAGLPKLPDQLDPEFLVGDHPYNEAVPRQANSLIEGIRTYRIPLSDAAIQARYQDQPIPPAPLSKENSHFDYAIKDGKLIPTLSLNGAIIPLKETIAEISLIRENETIATQSNLSFNGITLQGEFSSQLAQGDYQIRFRLKDQGNAPMGEILHTIRVPDMSWLGNSLGKEDIVPAPWTELKHEVADRQHLFHCWGRTYQFAESLLPSQITASGGELFTQAATLEFVSHHPKGKVIAPTFRALTVQESSPTRIRFQTQGDVILEQKSHPITVDYLLEYDGLLLITLHFDRPQEIQAHSIRLKFTIPEQHAIYHHGWNEDLVPFSKALDPSEGVIFQSTFLPSKWIGDHDRGLFWFCESAEHWPSWESPDAIELVRNESSIEWSLNLTQSSDQLKEDWKFQFGLQATPVKPLPKQWRKWSFPPMPNASPEILWPTPEEDSMIYFGYPEARNEQAFQKRIDRLHEEGKKVIPYSALNAISGHSPEWKWFGHEWDVQDGDYGSGDVVAVGAQFHYTSPTQESWRDFIVWKNHEFFVKHQLDGFYHDLTYPWAWAIESANTGWQDGETRRKTHPTLAYRELYRRHYQSIKSVNPDAFLIGHMSSWMNIPVLAYEDAILNGETLKVPLIGKSSYMKVLPLEQWRIEYTGRQWGVIPILLPEFDANAYEKFEPTRELAGLTLLHDVLVWPIWSNSGAWMERDQRLADFDLIHAEFIPYWGKHPTVLEAPEGIYVSFYRAPDMTILAVVCNTTEEAVEGQVRFNPIHVLDHQPYRIRHGDVLVPHQSLTIPLSIEASTYQLYILEPSS